MATNLNWLGDQVSRQISEKLASGLNNFNEQLAIRARANLYPGHGYDTGRMQASTTNRQVRMEGSSLVGSVGSFGIWYSIYVHERYYAYIIDAMNELLGSAESIITKG